MNAVTLAVEGHEGAAGLSTRRHALRHFYASRLIASGCDVLAAQGSDGSLNGDDDPGHAHPRGPRPRTGPATRSPSWRRPSWGLIGDRERQSGL